MVMHPLDAWNSIDRLTGICYLLFILEALRQDALCLVFLGQVLFREAQLSSQGLHLLALLFRSVNMGMRLVPVTAENQSDPLLK